ncbi:MAG: GH3 auxin-responsive promoter family protein [Clostridiaceae bacterium]|nr:GH3 auxin-responsive promoter family protein [Clostridiaceae bacterium]
MDIIQSALNFSFSLISNRYYKNFNRDTKKAAEVNKSVLMEILEMNKESGYGRTHNFKDIKDVKDYKRNVPITRYSDYENSIERIAKGESNILTCEAVEFFGLSSGTTGKQKYIPVTTRSRKVNNSYMNFLNQGLLYNSIPAAKKGGRGMFLVNMAKPSVITGGGIPAGAGTSEGIKAMKGILPYIWTSPIEVLEIPEQQVANYLHSLFALKERNLSYIASPFPSNIVQMFGVMEENWRELIKDIAEGTISGQLKLDPKIKILLEKKIKPNPKRAEEIKKEFTNGMDGICRRIWPNMHYVSCVAGGSFSIYINKLRYFIGELPVFSSVYGATEALIGMAVKPNDTTYVVVPGSVYFEFIPLSEQDSENPIALNLEELKVGESYEVVITNYSGFYRYRLGDIIKVVNYYHESPVIEFLYRRGQLLNIVAEKTQEAAVQHAVMTAVKKWGTELVDYTVIQDLNSTVGFYKFYVEVNNPEALINNIEKNRAILEKALGEANPPYLAGLEANRIAPLKLQVVKCGTFESVRKELLKKGASVNQVKIPRVINDKKLILLLDQNTEILEEMI